MEEGVEERTSCSVLGEKGLFPVLAGIVIQEMPLRILRLSG